MAPIAAAISSIRRPVSSTDSPSARNGPGLLDGARALVGAARAVLDRRDGELGLALDLADQAGDRRGRGLGLLGELADLFGDDGEAAALLAGAGGLDGGVEREQVGLLGDAGDGRTMPAISADFVLSSRITRSRRPRTRAPPASPRWPGRPSRRRRRPGRPPPTPRGGLGASSVLRWVGGHDVVEDGADTRRSPGPDARRRSRYRRPRPRSRRPRGRPRPRSSPSAPSGAQARRGTSGLAHEVVEVLGHRDERVPSASRSERGSTAR